LFRDGNKDGCIQPGWVRGYSKESVEDVMSTWQWSIGIGECCSIYWFRCVSIKSWNVISWAVATVQSWIG